MPYTPLHLSVLLQYNASNEVRLTHDTPVQYREHLIQDGLLERYDNVDSAFAVRITAKGRAHVKHLCDHPIPQLVWEDPLKPCDHREEH